MSVAPVSNSCTTRSTAGHRRSSHSPARTGLATWSSTPQVVRRTRDVAPSDARTTGCKPARLPRGLSPTRRSLICADGGRGGVGASSPQIAMQNAWRNVGESTIIQRVRASPNRVDIETEQPRVPGFQILTQQHRRAYRRPHSARPGRLVSSGFFRTVVLRQNAAAPG